ncbi:hypothetical protein BGZ76_004413 [Entomortierella beljakovae]|nr:hypothetical protein BGZ76_004413 [Entomortierella beljakovae]
MENVHEYQLVFLNELHDILKLLDPRRTSTAGLFRILGRLIEFDIGTQIAKVESCFHAQYTSSTNTGHYNSNKSIRSNNVDTIDLTNDGIKHSHGRYQSHRRNSDSTKTYECIDLTSSADEDDDEVDKDETNNNNTCHLTDKNTKRQSNGDIETKRTLGGPKVILWVDTRLLEPRKYDLKALFQFMGEVTYESGHWILCARTCRNMEGLDLYTYHQSILLTRVMMEEHQERQRSREPNLVHLIE